MLGLLLITKKVIGSFFIGHTEVFLGQPLSKVIWPRVQKIHRSYAKFSESFKFKNYCKKNSNLLLRVAENFQLIHLLQKLDPVVFFHENLFTEGYYTRESAVITL